MVVLYEIDVMSDQFGKFAAVKILKKETTRITEDFGFNDENVRDRSRNGFHA